MKYCWHAVKHGRIVGMNDNSMSAEPNSSTRESYDYGRLWPDGTFDSLHAGDAGWAKKQFDERAYELKTVPESLRPVLARQRVVVTTETYPAEAVVPA